MKETEYRAEIIANQSVQEEITEAIEQTDDNLYYTFIPAVQGKGRQRKRLGDETWPELNCMFILYVDETSLTQIRDIIQALKERFPNEGIKLFVTPAGC